MLAFPTSAYLYMESGHDVHTRPPGRTRPGCGACGVCQVFLCKSPAYVAKLQFELASPKAHRLEANTYDMCCKISAACGAGSAGVSLCLESRSQVMCGANSIFGSPSSKIAANQSKCRSQSALARKPQFFSTGVLSTFWQLQLEYRNLSEGE